MPSKKKKKKSGRGKAKKATDSLDAQMEELKIGGVSGDSQAYDEAAMLEEAIKLATAEKEALEADSFKEKRVRIRSWECKHGYVRGEEHAIINDFCKTFLYGFNSLGSGVLVGECVAAAHEAASQKHPEVWNDSTKLELAVSFFLLQGTQNVILGNLTDARTFAFFAYHFEDYIAVDRDKKKDTIDGVKQNELLFGDDHTLVKYLRKNIPCNCLDEKYKEVKSMTKMGMCWNPKCSHPNKLVERSSMLCCDRCRATVYCSPECQKAHWPLHKLYCENQEMYSNVAM